MKLFFKKFFEQKKGNVVFIPTSAEGPAFTNLAKLCVLWPEGPP